MKTRTSIVIALITIVCTLLVATPALAATSVTLNTYEKQLLTLINRQRAKRDLAKVTINAKLVDAARAHSTDMGTQKYFSHDSPDGETWSARIIRYGYTREGCRFWLAGEDIYYGAGLYSSPYVVMKAWMASKTHRAVILTKSFRNIGVGAVKTDDGYGNIDGTVWFFTIDLGRRILQ